MRLAPLVIVICAACASPRQKVAAPDSDFTFEFLSFTEGSSRSVTVSVGKEDPVAGMVCWVGVHRVGDRLGWSREGGVSTSRHRVRSVTLGREAEVDFNTGAVVRSIQINKPLSYEYDACVVGDSGCDGIRHRRASYLVNEVAYDDRNGHLKIVRSLVGRGPWGNAVCGRHLGAGDARKPPSRSDQERIERYATSLYAEANYDWGSRNPRTRRKAHATYLRLLSELACADVVVKNREFILSRIRTDVDR